jgi:hypothetical protein
MSPSGSSSLQSFLLNDSLLKDSCMLPKVGKTTPTRDPKRQPGDEYTAWGADYLVYLEQASEQVYKNTFW